MKFKIVVVLLLSLLMQTLSIAAKPPLRSSVSVPANPSFSNSTNDSKKESFTVNNVKEKSLSESLSSLAEECDDSDMNLAPSAAPCNGVSVTPITFSAASRTIISGTNNTTNVSYRYPAVGTAPNGTGLDAIVTITGYTNNQDTSPTTFSNSDINTVGFDGNLQPSITQTGDFYTQGATSWSGNITYNIKFVAAGTTTPVRISVAATTIDNDGSNVPTCTAGNPTTQSGTVPLRELVTYSPAPNQYLLSTTPATQQTRTGNTVFGPPGVIQTGIGIGADYAAATLFINVEEVNWTYGFATTQAMYGCGGNFQAEPRYGSLNMSCQIDFVPDFATVAVSGTVFNDTNGLNDSTVNGTGTNAGGLFANLLDSNGFVVSSVAVAANGTYTFPGVPTNATYSVQISTNQGIESSAAPANALPAGWANTGENLGTAAGNDGTVNSRLPITVAAAAITNANFGIEQPPVPVNNTAATQNNPGGTNSATVPATTFSATDPSAGGSVTSIRITGFPTNANSLTVGTTTYYATTLPGTCPTATCLLFPAGGVTVASNGSGNPTPVISVDPVSGGVTVGIPYVGIDNAGVPSTTTATASVPFAAFTVSGTVLNDTNGLSGTPANTVDGTGTNAGGPLFANLVQGGVVVQSVAVPANGTYSFAGVDVGSYSVVIATSATAVTSSLPAGWVNTGENIGTAAGNDGTVNGILPVTVTAANVTNANFGIEQRPTANNNTAASQTNPGGTNSATVPATTFTGTDATAITNIRITAFPTNANSLTVGTTTYYATTLPGTCPTATCALFPAGGVTTPAGTTGNPTAAILVDPVDGATTVGIPYVTIDAAGVESTSATASVPFGTVSLSGNVLNDVNGLNGTPANTVDGSGTNAGGPLYANLFLSDGTFVQSVLVPAGGVYSFAGLNSGSYTVQISTNQGTTGNPIPATALPTGWANTGENIGTTAGNDGTVNGQIAVTVGTTTVTNVNFGIEQRPTANNGSVGSNNNTGGTVFYTIAPTAFTASDPVSSTVSSIRITAFPSNATSIRINGVDYTSATFPVGGVTVPTNAAGNPTQSIAIDPINGNVTVGIPFVAIDQAGVESAAPAIVSAPFAVGPTSSNATISGRLIFGETPLTNTLVVLTNSANGAKRVVRTNADGQYSFSEAVGASYIIQPLSNKYAFGPSSQFVELRENSTDNDFASTAKNYRAKNDFDGDGQSDLAVYRAEEGNWYILQSETNEMNVINFGLATDIPVAGDFDGDGKADVAVFRPSDGNWYIRESSTQSLRVIRFGLADDKLVPADYDGDGKTDVAVYRNGAWYINQSSNNSLKVYNWGTASDAPTAGDFDGDGKADATVYRASEGKWYVLNSSSNDWKAYQFGLESDVPVAADYDGDGRTDIAQFRNGNWYVLNSTTDFQGEQFGQEGDTTVIGDFDGDGRTDMTVFKNGSWSTRNSANGTTKTTNFGLATDILVK